MTVNKDNPFIGTTLARSRSYSTFFEKRDELIRQWIKGLAPEEYKTLETLAIKFIERLREKQQDRHARNNPNQISPRNVTLIGVGTAMELLVLIALRDDIDFKE